MMEDKVLYELLQVMLDNKAEDLVYLNVSKVNPLAEFYVICTVASNRQALALSRYVDDCLAKNNIEVKHIEGNSGVSATSQKMIEQYRQNIIAIDKDIINELNSLFMGLY